MKHLLVIALAACGAGAVILANRQPASTLESGVGINTAVARVAESVDHVDRFCPPRQSALEVGETVLTEAPPLGGPALTGQTTAGQQSSAKAQRQDRSRVDLDGSIGARKFGQQRVDVTGSIGARQPRGNRVDVGGSIGARKFGQQRVDVTGSIGARQPRGNRVDVGGSIGAQRFDQQRVDVTGSIGAVQPRAGRVDVRGNMDTIASNWIDCEPLVTYAVTGNNLLGPCRLQFSAYSDGTVTLAELDPSMDGPRFAIRVLNTLILDALMKDLMDAGAYTLTDSQVQVQDLPMSTVTVFGPSQAGKSQAFSFNYYPVGGPWDAVDDMLNKFINWYFPRQISY